MRYLLLILSLLVAQPAAAIIIKQGPGGSGDASVRSAADCTAETGGTEDEVCVETGTGQGVFRCSTATCEGAGWERADDTVGAGGGIVNTIAAVDGGGASSGADIIMGTGAGLDTFHAGDTITYSFDPTELGNLTWGTGSQLAWTFNAGATDPVMTVNSDQVDWTNVATFTLDTNQVLTDATTFVGDVGGTSGATVIQADSVEATMVAFPFALADGELIDMTLVVPNTATEGLILPQIGSACAGATANGQICYDTAGNDLYIGNGAGVDQMNAGSGHGDGADCSAGSYPLGVDASGAVTSCTDATTEIDSAIATHVTAADAAYEAELDNSAGLLAALDDETGTGVAVFSASPTFTGTVGAAAITATGAVDTGAHTATSYTSDPSATPTWATQDSNMGGTPDQNTLVIANCPTGTTAGGDEDCDLAFQTQVAGTPTEAFRIDTTDGGTQTVVFTADPVFPADAVITADITNSNVTEDKLAADLAFDDGDSLDLTGITLSATGEGLIITSPADCDAITGVTTGTVCYDTTDDAICVYDGAAMDCQDLGAAGSGDVTDVMNCAGPDCGDIAAADGDSLDLTGVTLNATGEGLILTSPADCDAITGVSTGTICYDTTDDSICVFDGAAMDCQVLGGGGGETFAQTLALGADGNDVDMTSLGRLEFFDAGLYFDADADGVMDITSDGTLELHSADWDISTTGVITGAGNITSDGTVTAVTVSGNAAADLDVDANGQNVTLGDGGTTNYLAVADDGTMTTNGSAGIYTDSTVSIPAAAWVLSTTPPTEATYGTNYPESVLDFATDADDQAFIKLAIPTDFNDTNQANMTWVIRWTADTATVGDVCLCIAADPLQNGDDPDLNTGTVTGCADITVAGADDLEETTFTMAASTFETAEMMNVRLYRDVDAGHGDCTADDMADDASVFAVTLNYGVLKQ